MLEDVPVQEWMTTDDQNDYIYIAEHKLCLCAIFS